MPDNQTLAQRRAKDALSNIHTLKDKGNYGKYRSYVKSLPANILMTGLGQAVATICSREEKRDGYKELYNHLENWLCGDDVDMPYKSYPGSRYRLLSAITSEGQDAYIHAQAEALAYLEWLRKFADAFLEEGDDD